MKKETHIVVFYILYFSWLFLVTFLTPSPVLVNIFAVVVVVFYFIFLKEHLDILFFSGAFILSLILNIEKYQDSVTPNITAILENVPVWIPFAWGTTLIALRKFYLIVNQRIN